MASEKTYYRVAAALLVLLAATVGFAYVPLGHFSPVVALGIAAAKAILIVLFFMHARYSNPLVKLFAAVGLFWLALLIVGTLSDVVTRGW